jgi:hypothetical protein
MRGRELGEALDALAAFGARVAPAVLADPHAVLWPVLLPVVIDRCARVGNYPFFAQVCIHPWNLNPGDRPVLPTFKLEH